MGWHEVEEDDYQDVRFAVVMNGGVSLAIWMGGVTTELNRLTHRAKLKGDIYGELLNIVKATARVDVITGTSAGGINGAFLALAETYGVGLKTLGELWAKKGAFLDLLRGPLEKDPPSLMRGDDYFLVELRKAFEEILPRKNVEPVARDKAPIDLTITGTLLSGEPVTFVDDFGTRLTELEHRARFTFRRDETTAENEDPFESSDIAARLALASRTTASFPGAFEPSFVPVGSTDTDVDHPDMSGNLTLGKDLKIESDRFLIDGGVLMNQPIAPAIEAIMQRPADRQVRRVLAYINPDPRPETRPGSAAKRTEMPGLAEVILASLITLPGSQSVREELQQIEDHNRRVRDRRLTRADLASVLVENSADLPRIAERLFQTYRKTRLRRRVHSIASQIAEAQPGVSSNPTRPGEAPPAWSREEFVAAFERARFDYIPDSPPTTGEISLAKWGLGSIEGIGAIVGQTFRLAMWLAPFEKGELRSKLRARRAELHSYLRGINAARRADRDFWRAEAATTLPEPPSISSERSQKLATWAQEALDRWPAPHGSAGQTAEEALTAAEILARSVIGVAIDAASDLRQTVQVARSSKNAARARAQRAERADDLPPASAPDWLDETDRLEHLLDLILGTESSTNDPSTAMDDALRSLLAFEVCHSSLGDPGMEVEQEAELIQISGNTDTSFISRSLTAAEKLTGVELAHFAAFYKKSWRVNDWIWGRLDGATRLCEAVLAPSRLYQLELTAEEALALVEQVAVGPEAVETDDDCPTDDRQELSRRFEEERPSCADELAFLDDPTLPVPPSLPTCAMAIARRLHLGILREELPRLATACRDDAEAKAGRGAGESFLWRYERSSGSGKALGAGEIFDMFAQAEIGGEEIGDEFPSDLMAATVSTTAAVAVSAAQAPGTKLGAAGVLLRPLRGFTLALYALARNATAGGFGAAMVSLVLALGGSALALSLLGDAPPAFATFGTAVLLAGIALAALRTHLIGLVLLLLVPALILGLGLWASGGVATIIERGSGLLIMFAFALFGLVLGMVGTKERPRKPGWSWRRRG